MAEILGFRRSKRLKSLDEFDRDPFKVLQTFTKPLSQISLALLGFLLGGSIGLTWLLVVG